MDYTCYGNPEVGININKTHGNGTELSKLYQLKVQNNGKWDVFIEWFLKWYHFMVKNTGKYQIEIQDNQGYFMIGKRYIFAGNIMKGTEMMGLGYGFWFKKLLKRPYYDQPNSTMEERTILLPNN